MQTSLCQLLLQEHVDSSAAYDTIPLTSTLDVKSKDRTDGLQYRAGLHYVSASQTQPWGELLSDQTMLVRNSRLLTAAVSDSSADLPEAASSEISQRSRSQQLTLAQVYAPETELRAGGLAPVDASEAAAFNDAAAEAGPWRAALHAQASALPV